MPVVSAKTLRSTRTHARPSNASIDLQHSFRTLEVGEELILRAISSPRNKRLISSAAASPRAVPVA